MSLGAQGTVCAGGRYDALVETLGGQPTPAVGFAMGLRAFDFIIATTTLSSQDQPDVFCVLSGRACFDTRLVVVRAIASRFT